MAPFFSLRYYHLIRNATDGMPVKPSGSKSHPRAVSIRKSIGDRIDRLITLIDPAAYTEWHEP